MDPISNMLTAIRNAQAVLHPSLMVPDSKLKRAILTILKREGFIENFSLTESPKPMLLIELRYHNHRPAIAQLRRVSKPGLRIYRKRNDLPRPLRGMGMAIVSTPNGVLTDREARKLGLGGEILCEVW